MNDTAFWSAYWTIYVLSSAAYWIHLFIAIGKGGIWEGQRVMVADVILAMLPGFNTGAAGFAWIKINPRKQSNEP